MVLPSANRISQGFTLDKKGKTTVSPISEAQRGQRNKRYAVAKYIYFDIFLNGECISHHYIML